jgi:2-keto-4-pentenoate hydratase/2-oxohepta-3-ene-1,7-dioic acid hydratase in catechol pathway
MRFASVAYGGKELVVATDPSLQELRPVLGFDHEPVTSMVGLIELLDGGRKQPKLGRRIDSKQARVLAPIPRPRRNILCVGKNYREHAQEFTRSGFDSSASSVADAIPGAPIVFTKMPETVIGPNDPIRYPGSATEQLDYEVELTVVIGRAGVDIPGERALEHVFGYTIVNDVTARDRQARYKQWFLGKSLDTFCPMGPWIATPDEVDLKSTKVRCWVNGELRQDANTRDLIFDVPTIIATISQGMTLLPGDVIATGTPAGVGIGFSPPRFLQRGDTVAMEIDGLGRLVNVIE